MADDKDKDKETGTGISLVVEHIATKRRVTLGGFAITEFSDTLTTNYNSQDVYGRVDPIVTYQGTNREISLGVAWTSSDSTVMTTVQEQIVKLMMFQYPTYADVTNALAIQSPPLVRVKFANFIAQGYEYGSKGLVCAMKGIAYTPGVGHTPQNSPMVRYGENTMVSAQTLSGSTASNARIIPNNMSIKMSLIVLHEESLGWHFNEDKTYGWMPGEKQHFGPKHSPINWGHDGFTDSSIIEPPAEPPAEPPPKDD